MGNRRRYQGDVPRMSTLSQNRKPAPGFLKPTVPSWEKKFCFSVGSITWRKLLETKKTMCHDKNVVEWNDSAVEEAFHNAKKRFWAEINGLPYDVSLPDPDMYIDEVDWNSEIDPELLLGLDEKPVVPENDEKVELVGDSLFYLNQPVVPTGWGDAEEVPIRMTEKVELLGDSLFCLNQPIVPTGWGDAEEDPIRTTEKVELVGDSLLYLNQPIVPTGWGDAEEDPIRTAEKVELLGDSLFHLNQPVMCTGWGD